MKKPVPTAPTVPAAPVAPVAETADLPRIMDVVHKDTGRTMTVSKAYYLAHAGKLTIA